VFGGATPVDNKYASCRNVFLCWAHESGYELADFLITPEDYREWNQFEGYDNLIDFERDAGCLSRGILLFSECEGAFAELGAFSMDDDLCERLLVVVAREHYYDAPSFIRLGPIRRIEKAHSSGAICVVDSTNDKHLFEAEVAGVGDALKSKVKTLPKTSGFRSSRRRDQFLLIVDLVDLFGALTEREVQELLSFMGITHEEPKRLENMLNLLTLLGLVVRSGYLTQRFLVPPKDRSQFLDYSAQGELKFDRARFKLVTALPALNKDSARRKAYEKIHGEKCGSN
jgi:hypothetical protein